MSQPPPTISYETPMISGEVRCHWEDRVLVIHIAPLPDRRLILSRLWMPAAAGIVLSMGIAAIAGAVSGTGLSLAQAIVVPVVGVVLVVGVVAIAWRLWLRRWHPAVLRLSETSLEIYRPHDTPARWTIAREAIGAVAADSHKTIFDAKPWGRLFIVDPHAMSPETDRLLLLHGYNVATVETIARLLTDALATETKNAT